MTVAYRTFREIRIDRKLRVRPLVVFQPGANPLRITRRPFRHRIGGVNPTYVEKLLANLPPDGPAIDLEKSAYYGELLNTGVGAALQVEVTWVPRELKLGTEAFTLDEKKLTEPRYSTDLNSMPCVPHMLKVGEHGELSRIPSFLILDFDSRIREVSGHVVIDYRDIEGTLLRTYQEFLIWTDDHEGKMRYWVTFGDILATTEVRLRIAASGGNADLP